MISSKWIVAAVVSNLVLVPMLSAQPTHSAPADAPSVDERIDRLTQEVEELKALVHQLQSQLAAEPARTSGAAGAPAPAVTSGPPAAASPNAASVAAAGPGNGAAAGAAPANAAAASGGVVGDLLHGVTINAMLDGYYEYNTDNPIGRVNDLRAYDVSSNSFSLNQADLVLESAPDLSGGKREGFRIDLQYGQATSTLQGNPANELRPTSTETFSRPTAPMCFRSVPASPSISASGQAPWASRATTPRIS